MSRVLPHPFREPMLISEEGLHLVLAVWSRGELHAEVLAAAREQRPDLTNGHSMEVADGVAVIPIVGPLMRHASILQDVSGATSYASIDRDLRQALADPDVREIALRIDSPGGEANGVAELAQRIRAADATKPVRAYVEGTGASAAYWLASAAREIVAAPTARLGSIGVRIMLTDDGMARAEQRVRDIEIVSTQSPDKRGAMDSLLPRLQQRADELAEVFIADVARLRGRSVDHVQEHFGRGDTLMGQRAVTAGLADRLGSLDGLLSEMHGRTRSAKSAQPQEAERTPPPAGMSKPETTPTAAPPAPADTALQQELAALRTEVADLRALRAAVVEATGQTTGLIGAVHALKTNADLAAKLGERAQVGVIVSEMIRDGQIGPAEKTHYEAYSLADAQSAQRLLRKNAPAQTAPGSNGAVSEKGARDRVTAGTSDSSLAEARKLLRRE